MNVEIRHLRQFLALAEELHFTRASERLQIAQSALSVSIRKLEEALDLRLFTRNTRSVELTNEGQIFAEEARLVVESYDRALNTAARLRGGGTGPVTFGLHPQVSAEIKRVIVSRLREINPDVQLTIVAENTSKLVESVRARRVDAALCVAPVAAGDLTRIPVSDEAMLVALPSSHPLASRDSVGLGELRDEKWVLPSGRSLPESSFLTERCAEAGFSMRPAEAVSDFDDDFSTVAEGKGIIVVPSGFVGERKRRGVVLVPIEGLAAPIHLVTRSEGGPPALQSGFEAVTDAIAAAGSRAWPRPAETNDHPAETNDEVSSGVS